MDANTLPSADYVWGDPEDPLCVQIQNAPDGLPLTILIDPNLCSITRVDKEEVITLVIEKRERS